MSGGGISDAQFFGMVFDFLVANWITISLICGTIFFVGYLKIKMDIPIWQSTNFLIVTIAFFAILYQSFVDGNGIIVSFLYAIFAAFIARIF